MSQKLYSFCDILLRETIVDYRETLNVIDEIKKECLGDNCYVNNGVLGKSVLVEVGHYDDTYKFVPFKNQEEAKAIYNGIIAMKNYFRRAEISDLEERIKNLKECNEYDKKSEYIH